MNQELVSPEGETTYKYWAFISYSHADDAWAKWLHKELETFPVPKALVGKKTERGYNVPKRLMPVFRDRDELPGSSTLKDNIQEALEQSRYLLVICSPRSAASIWVNNEVLIFKAMGRGDRVLCLIVDGEPNATDKPACGLLECFPPAVRYAVNPDRTLSQEREEPIAADARPGKDGKVDALLKLAAGLLGAGFDELKQRDARRRQRRKVGYAMAGAALVAFLSWGASEFKAQRVRLQNAASSMADFREAAATFDSGDSGLGMAYLGRALKKDPANKTAAQRLFYELTYKNWVQSVKQVATGDGCVLSAQISSDFSKLALVTSGTKDQFLLVIDIASGQELLRHKGTAEWGPRFVSFCGNNIVALRASVPADAGIPNSVAFFDLQTGEKLKDMQVADHTANCVISSEDGAEIFIGWGKTSPTTYWDADRYGLVVPDGAKEEEEPRDTDSIEPKSGAIHRWQVGEKEVLLTPTTGPVISLQLNEALGLLYAAGSSTTKGVATGYIREFSTRDLGTAGDPIRIDSPVYDIRISDDGKLVLSCADRTTRIYGEDFFTGATVLQSSTQSKGTTKVLPLGNMVGMASASGHAKVVEIGGELVIPEWGLDAVHAGLDTNEPFNLTLVSYAGISPLDRGGRVLVKSLLDPRDDLMPAPLEPPLWWPSQSIFLANVSQRAEKLFVVRHEWTAEGLFRWDLLSVELSNRAAKTENVACRDILPGTVSKSSSGRYFVCLVRGVGEDPNEILIYDAMSRKERRRIAAPKDVSAVAFSADEKTIVAFSKKDLTIYDSDLRKVREFAIEGAPAQEDGAQLLFWQTLDVLPNSPFAAVVGIVETNASAKGYNLSLFDFAKGLKLSTAPLPGRPDSLQIAPNADAFVVSWNEGELDRCALMTARDGALLREFPRNQTPGSFSFDGRRFVMNGTPNHFLYDTRDWSQIAELSGHSRMISALAFDPQNRFLATGALDGNIRLWDLQNGLRIGEEMPPLFQRKSKSSRAVTNLQFNQTGDRLLAGFSQWVQGELMVMLSSIAVWDTSEQLATIPERQTRFLANSWFVEGGDCLALVTGTDGGQFVSFLDASFPEQELPSDAWKIAQEVSGYDVNEQISKSDRLPQTVEVVDRVRQGLKGTGSKVDRWLEWYVSPSKDRTVSPLSQVQTSEYRRVLMEDMRTHRYLVEAFEMDPKDNLNLANWAIMTESHLLSEAMWKVLLKDAGDDKDIIYRRAVRLFENSWYEWEDNDICKDVSRDLTLLVRHTLENDLAWSPLEQGLTRNRAFSITRGGFLSLIAHSGSPELAKEAALLSIQENADLLEEYSTRPQRLLESSVQVAVSTCGSEIRRAFWLDQAGHPFGKQMVQCWASFRPGILINAARHDADFWADANPEWVIPRWDFTFERLREASQGAAPERQEEFSDALGSLSSIIALKLLESGLHFDAAEKYARESFSLREQAGVTGWPLANSKSMIGAALLQQNKLSEAEPFVVEGAKELVALKDTVPEQARLRVIEAVDRAKSLYEKVGNQAEVSYWSAELAKLQSDPQ